MTWPESSLTLAPCCSCWCGLLHEGRSQFR